MSETPLGDALRDIPKNGLKIEGGVSKGTGGELHGTIGHEKNGKAIGFEGGISQKKGWSVAGFFSWMWK